MNKQHRSLSSRAETSEDEDYEGSDDEEDDEGDNRPPKHTEPLSHVALRPPVAPSAGDADLPPAPPRTVLAFSAGRNRYTTEDKQYAIGASPSSYYRHAFTANG